MYIKRIELISFGKFKNKTIILTDGFNLIYGENGAGKTTIADFIKLMFYGRCGNDRSRDISKSPRKKYMPWDGSPMSGALEFEHSGHTYLLSRTFGKAPSADNVTLFDVDRGENVSVNAADFKDNIGTRFFGMELDEFERTVFIGERIGFDSAYSGNALAMKISNLSVSGDETISEKSVCTRLAAAKETLVSKNGKKGLLPDSRAELERLRSEYARESDALDNQLELAESIERTRAELAALESTAAAANNAEKLASFRRELKAYNYIDEKFNALSNALNVLRSSVRGFAHISENDAFNISVVQSALSDIKPRLAECRLLRAQNEFGCNSAVSDNKNTDENITSISAVSNKKVRGIAAAFLILVGLSALLAGYFYLTLFYAVGAVFVAAAFALLISTRRRTKSEKTACEDDSALCRAISKMCGTEFADYAAARRTLDIVSDAYDSASSALHDIVTAAEASGISELSPKSVKNKIFEINGIICAFPSVSPTAPKADELENRIREKRGELENLSLKFTPPRVSLRSTEAQIADLERRTSEYEKQYQSLCIADEVMREAIEETRRGLGTRLSMKTRGYLENMSEDFASTAVVSQDLQVHFLPQNSSEYRDVKNLSCGQAARVYLALRLAAADIAAVGSDKVPLFLDDPFSQYDEKSCRAAAVFLGNYLRDSGTASQALFFTCHKNIEELLANVIPAANRLTTEK